MALLIHEDTGRQLALAERVLIGRGRQSDLRLTDGAVSTEHAVLSWRQDRWTLRDLGSRNGTRVDDAAVPPGASHALTAGARLRFGSDAEIWRLALAGPPGPVAIAETQIRESHDGLLAVPDDDAPELVVFATPTGRWLAEIDGAPRYLEAGEPITIGADAWQIHLPSGRADEVASTLVEGQPSAALCFAVSGDEEFVEVRIGSATLTARSFHYMLLTLARLRRRDADAGVTHAERGWVHVEDLCRMLDVDPQRLNVEVYRARRQFAAEGLCAPGRLIERRSTSRQLRFGMGDFVIERL